MGGILVDEQPASCNLLLVESHNELHVLDAICQLLGPNQLSLSRLAIFYSGNAYGEGYFQALKEECEAVGVQAQGWPIALSGENLVSRN